MDRGYLVNGGGGTERDIDAYEIVSWVENERRQSINVPLCRIFIHERQYEYHCWQVIKRDSKLLSFSCSNHSAHIPFCFPLPIADAACCCSFHYHCCSSFLCHCRVLGSFLIDAHDSLCTVQKKSVKVKLLLFYCGAAPQLLLIPLFYSSSWCECVYKMPHSKFTMHHVHSTLVYRLIILT